MKLFKDQVAVITGAGSGIGQCLALNLAKRGCHLAISDINTSGLDDTEVKIKNINSAISVKKYLLNVADKASISAFAETVTSDFNQINILFNNAGITLIDSVEHSNIEHFEQVMNVNFWGVVNTTKAFLPLLKQQNQAAIINISSLFGLIAIPYQSAYNASKFAVKGFSEALAFELKDTPVEIYCVHPGGIQTNIAKNAIVPGSEEEKNNIVSLFASQAKTTPEKAAQIIMHGIERKQRRIIVGRDAKIADIIARLFPSSYEKMLKF